MANLLDNIELLHTTPMGIERIKKNLNLCNEDVINYCKNAILNAEMIKQIGKNYYVYYKDKVITVNAKSYTVITAHPNKAKARVIEKFDC